MRLSGIGVGLLINFYVVHLRDGIKRMVNGKDWGEVALLSGLSATSVASVLKVLICYLRP